jgi:hypothetical protein
MLPRFLKKKAPAAMGEAASNDLVRAQLKKMGDEGVEVRHVVHYAYPKKGADLSSRKAMIEHLKTEGYEVKDAAQEDGGVLEHYRSVAGADFDRVTVGLSNWFAGKGWSYDGWECAVVTEKPVLH